jgi:hypothetical protein
LEVALVLVVVVVVVYVVLGVKPVVVTADAAAVLELAQVVTPWASK